MKKHIGGRGGRKIGDSQKQKNLEKEEEVKSCHLHSTAAATGVHLERAPHV